MKARYLSMIKETELLVCDSPDEQISKEMWNIFVWAISEYITNRLTYQNLHEIHEDINDVAVNVTKKQIEQGDTCWLDHIIAICLNLDEKKAMFDIEKNEITYKSGGKLFRLGEMGDVITDTTLKYASQIRNQRLGFNTAVITCAAEIYNYYKDNIVDTPVMQRLLNGEELEALIYRVIPYGMFVKIEDKLDGVIKNADMPSDFISNVGDRITVKLKKVNDRGTVILEPISNISYAQMQDFIARKMDIYKNM